MIAISPYLTTSLKLLLNGDSNLSPEINSNIFLKVHKYIIDTHRFWGLKYFVLKYMRLVVTNK